MPREKSRSPRVFRMRAAQTKRGMLLVPVCKTRQWSPCSPWRRCAAKAAMAERLTACLQAPHARPLEPGVCVYFSQQPKTREHGFLCTDFAPTLCHERSKRQTLLSCLCTLNTPVIFPQNICHSLKLRSRALRYQCIDQVQCVVSINVSQ